MPVNERVIFDAALEIADPGTRLAFVEKACDGDAELQARVRSLLQSHEAAGSFLEVPAVDPPGKGSADTTGNTIVGVPPGKDDDDSDDGQFSRIDLSFLDPSARAGSIGTLGHYEILKMLGQGGFGVVFKAFDERLHRHVAIKVMNPQIAATSPPRRRFLREARSAAAIRHENVVAVHSVEEQPLPYLVMEFIDGETLQEKLDRTGPLDVPEILYLGRQIASGLAAAHALSLIHRDIKPGNILIEGDVEQKIKITDFGLARAADDASLTRSGVISGTPMYMAPEQALGQPLDHRTDLFSLGSVLYQMACGRPPFRAPTTVAVLRRVADDTPRTLQEIVPELPDWLVDIINRLLAKKPEDRFQSAKEVAELLGRCQSELQLTAQVTCVPARNPASGVASAPRVPPNHGTSERLRPPLATMTDPGVAPAKKLTANKIIRSMLLGLLIVSPVLFGRHLSRAVNAWLEPEIPTSGAIDRAAGLQFDGKDDCIWIPVQWDSPQFTIEAFVTSDKEGETGTVLQLSNEETGDREEQFQLFDATDTDRGPQSIAGITGTNGRENVVAPLTRGVREHRAIVHDGQTLHYFVNGLRQGQCQIQPRDGLMWKMKRLTVGCDLKQTGFFRGTIDQLRASKVVLYRDNFPPVGRLTASDTTLALYNFDEGTGDLLKDVSGHGHDGRIAGATWVRPTAGELFPEAAAPESEISNPATGRHHWPADAPPPAISPFSAEQAKQYQEAWAGHLGVTVEFENSIGMPFVLIPPGEFLMGYSREELDTLIRELKQAGATEFDQFAAGSSGPQHKVRRTGGK